MPKFKVNAGYQIDVGGKLYADGETFTASDAELDEFGSRPYVSEVRAAAENKAVAKPEPSKVTKTPAEPVKSKSK